jgi:hypothetical protein
MMAVKETRTVNATLLDIMECLVVDMRVVEHGFGGNTTDVQARPTKGPALLYTCGLGNNEAME